MNINGKILTPTKAANFLVNYTDRIIVKNLSLGRNGSAEDWAEITSATKERLEKEWREEENV